MKKFLCFLGFFIITSFFVLPEFSLGETVGPNNPSVANNDTSSGSGTIQWNINPLFNIDNIGSASTSLAVDRTSKFLKFTNFGFSVPIDAIINGITVNLAKRGTGSAIHDVDIFLVANLATTTSKGDSSIFWPSSFDTFIYGSGSDNWGRVWTPAEINDSNFGVVVSVHNSDTTSSRTATIDGVSVVVDYSLPAVVIDTIPPLITINGGDTSLYVGDAYIDQGATATDDKDGDITSKIVSSSTVNTSIVGNYFVTYNVSDNAGNKAEQKIRSVVVSEKKENIPQNSSGGRRREISNISNGEVLGAFISKEDNDVNYDMQIKFLFILEDYIKLLTKIVKNIYFV